MTHAVICDSDFIRDLEGQLARRAGISLFDLMRRAGAAVAQAALNHFPAGPVLVLCGPGNNGGDGFVAARILQERGCPVTLACLVPVSRLSGDAVAAAALWEGSVEFFIPDLVTAEPFALVIDAVFGIGCDRPLPPAVCDVFAAVVEAEIPVLAVDIPSGVHADTGAADPHTLGAALTVTFFAKKPGHVLYPARALCGEIVCDDLGFALSSDDPLLAGGELFENGPELWVPHFRVLDWFDHKYTRGVVGLLGGSLMTGAARLAASSAARVGAGMVIVAAEPSAVPIYQATLPAHILVRPHPDLDGFLSDRRISSLVVGPGFGAARAGELRAFVLQALTEGRGVVLDADGLSAFAGRDGDLHADPDQTLVLTPHAGEFERLFPDLSVGSKVDRALMAAQRTAAVVVFKGADTVIAAPDGRTVVNTHSSVFLATAGAGDVLAGLIGGLMAQGWPAFEAACAAVWIQGEAALLHGPGLVASDLPEVLPEVLGPFFS